MSHVKFRFCNLEEGFKVVINDFEPCWSSPNCYLKPIQVRTCMLVPPKSKFLENTNAVLCGVECSAGADGKIFDRYLTVSLYLLKNGLKLNETYLIGICEDVLPIQLYGADDANYCRFF